LKNLMKSQLSVNTSKGQKEEKNGKADRKQKVGRKWVQHNLKY